MSRIKLNELKDYAPQPPCDGITSISRGSRLQRIGHTEVYIVAHIGEGKHALVSLDSGNIWSSYNVKSDSSACISMKLSTVRDMLGTTSDLSKWEVLCD